MVVFKTSGRIAGRVVDSEGQPVGGAAVFNRDDGPANTTSTDPQGLFQLHSLTPGPKYVFVRKEGFRFTSTKVTDDADSLTITILKASDPPPPWKPGAAPSLDRERAFAKQILVRLWKKFGLDDDENRAVQCILAMAPIDRPLALQWLSERGPVNDSRVRQIAAAELAKSEVPGTLALLSKDHDKAAQSFFQKLAQRFATSDPMKSRQFADEAIARARALGDENERAPALAETGAMLLNAGRVEDGRTLIAEAEKAAWRLDTEGPAAQARARVAGAVALVDVKNALALVEPITEDDKDRYIAFIARAIALTDTAQAVALTDRMNGPTPVQQRVKTAIAYMIAAMRPDEAIKIVEGIDHDDSGRWRAEAFGWLAVALAPHDRSRAHALIDRALNMLSDDAPTAAKPEQPADAMMADAMMAAAHVAARARQIAYPDMESVINRVLAGRPDSGAREPRRNIRLARLATVSLALLDPAAARNVLGQIEDRSRSIGLHLASLPYVRGPWLMAWATVDHDKARNLVDAELAALDDSEEADLVLRGLLDTVELLATPPPGREAVIKHGLYGGSWRSAEFLDSREIGAIP